MKMYIVIEKASERFIAVYKDVTLARKTVRALNSKSDLKELGNEYTYVERFAI